MKRRTMFLIVALCLFTAATSFAADSNVGTWKLNESKSKIVAGSPKNNTVVYTADGDSYKCVTDGTDGAGKPSHNEWTGKFDGKDYPVTGDASADSRSILKIDDHHYKIANKKDGKTTLSGTINFSDDGKNRTLTTHGSGSSGKKVTNVFEYDSE